MKRLLSMVISVVMMVSLAGCGNGEAGADASGSNMLGNEGPEAEVDEEPAALAYEPVSLEGEITGEITVAAYDAMSYSSFLDDAARAFEEKYPGTKVTVEIQSAMPEPKTMEMEDGTTIAMISNELDPNAVSDYMTKVNTEMMSGGGADIYAMDVLPYYKYAESGLLENLNAYMAADGAFSRSDYWENVLEGAQYKNGLYILPVDFNFMVLCYDSELVSDDIREILHSKDVFTYDEIIALGKRDFEPQGPADSLNKIINLYGGFQAFSDLFDNKHSNFLDITNKKANFNDGSFAAFLNEVKALETDGYIRENEQIDFDAIDFNEYLSRPQQAYNYYFASRSQMMLNELFLNNPDLNISLGYDMGDSENAVIAGMLADGQGNINFNYNKAFGLNTNSGNKRTAWEFMKFLLSYDVQMSANLYGQPINKEAGNEKAELNFTGAIYYPDQSMAPKLETDADYAAFEEYKAALNKYSAMVNYLRITDTLVAEMIDAEVEAFFDGDRTAEEAAQNIQNKVELYLSE